MKIKCEVCEKAEAEILCFADEAVICRECDEKVHAANKLSSKHQRVCLLKHSPSSSSSSSSSSHLPLCDICKEKNGCFFCLEDRAILCRQCEVSTHKASPPFLSSHQRFLIAGIKVSLQSSINGPDISSTNLRRENCQSFRDLMFTEISATSSTEANMETTGPCWPLNEILGAHDFYYDFSDMESSKTTGNGSFS
ncbi:hypothetical protein SLE2022_327650 [Rubroshorea leprosula]